MSENTTIQANSSGAEPLLAIEKKLIGWSLGIGITLLVVLAVLNKLIGVGA